MFVVEVLVQSRRGVIRPIHGTAGKGAVGVDWTHESINSEKRARSSSGASVGLTVAAIR